MFHAVRTNHLLSGIVCLSLSVIGTQTVSAKEFDVSESSAAQNIEKYFDSIAPGNDGSADIKDLVLDTNSLEVHGRISVTAAHSWGSISVPATSPPFYRDVEIAAEKTVHAGFCYNLDTNRVTGDVSLGRISLGVTVAGERYSKDFGEIRVDLEQIERILQGDWMDLVESIPNPGNVIGRERRSDYETVLGSYGQDVYFASYRFVNWASAERLARWGAELVVTDGAAVERIMKEAQAEASKELPEVTKWLQQRGIQNARTVAQSILSGERVQWPQLSVQFQGVKFESRVTLRGRPVGPWIAVRHAAFAIIWTAGGGGGTSGIGTVWGYANGEFRHIGSGQWQEFQNGQLRYSFRETGRTASSVELFDNSRGISVSLTTFKATVKQGSQTLMSINGGWKWQEWTYVNGKGRFVEVSPNRWAEYQDGRMAYTFSLTARGANEVHLFDAGRSIAVKLTSHQAIVTSRGSSLGAIQGNWTR